ncbi:hypothetical protein BVRB_5g102290 [Beta vulgaris subsp. vulgaris]|nr:hypothetical protein BVRB_5g102290 [Beta vulgaris subsp. vulgaris]
MCFSIIILCLKNNANLSIKNTTLSNILKLINVCICNAYKGYFWLNCEVSDEHNHTSYDNYYRAECADYCYAPY